jgi:hypothetical protein
MQEVGPKVEHKQLRLHRIMVIMLLFIIHMQYNQITSLTGQFTCSTSFHFTITITGIRYVVA